MSQLTAAQMVHEFVLSKISDEPLRKRALLYSALAQLAATPAESRNFRTLAGDCSALADAAEEIELRTRQLLLDFQTRAREDSK